jgi:hypothetical protein
MLVTVTWPFAGAVTAGQGSATHVGAVELQLVTGPTAWQSRVAGLAGVRAYPGSQAYVATEGYLPPLVTDTVPWAGACTAGQLTAAHVGAGLSHLTVEASATHPRVDKEASTKS